MQVQLYKVPLSGELQTDEGEIYRQSDRKKCLFVAYPCPSAMVKS